MIKEIYFDNSATTKVSEKAAEAAVRTMREDFGNPSSVHSKGAAAFHALNEARSAFAQYLDVVPSELYFTSCGTESNNIVIQGAAKAYGKAGKIFVSAVEHPSVYEPSRYLLSSGYDVAYLPVNQEGVIQLDALSAMLEPDTTLVSIMHVNNETGAIQPLREAGEIIKSIAPQAIFHIDAVQSFGRLPLDIAGWKADAVSISGHKIHAPKGIGLLWLKKGINLPALTLGGGQENGFRSGTENMSSILAFAAAAKECYAAMDSNYRQMQKVKDTLCQQLQTAIPACIVNGPLDEHAAAHIVNISFPGIRSEVMLHSLEAKGIFVSAGSACTSKSSKGSRILTAMGLDESRIDSALRFSFCRYNTVEEAIYTAKVAADVVTELSGFMNFTKRKQRK